MSAEELAAAQPYLALTERKARYHAEAGGFPLPFDIGRLLAEYDRMRADLARALPVVEAAGAVVEHAAHRGHVGWQTHLEYLLDALARAVRAVREPGGEQG